MDEDVDVRQTALLKFYNMNVADGMAHHPVVDEVVHERVQLELEHPEQLVSKVVVGGGVQL